MTDTGIECFLAVCRHQTISRAAEALFITQSSLSTRLRNLEQQLGGQLFYRRRGSREMVLTPAGKEFYTLAMQHRRITQKMLQVCRHQSQTLRVSSLNSLGTFLLPRVYRRFMEQYPTVELQIQDMELDAASRSLLSDTTDIAFISGKSTNEYLTQTPVFREDMVVICSQSIPLEGTVSRAQLQALPELYIQWSKSFCRWHDETLGEDHPQLTVAIMAHLQEFLEQQPSFAIVPITVAKGLAQTCAIRFLETDFPLPDREISLLSAAEKSTVSDFVECLKAELAEHPEIHSLLN